MLRTKQSVDRHVEDILRRIDNEKERSLRCYNIAKLYYQVRDYETARRYVSDYLEVKEESPLAHKLLGEIYEALGRKEAALDQYKTSLLLDAKQDNLVMKVCELLTDEEISYEPNRIQYWAERAAEKFPNHPVVFQLKEKMIKSNGPMNDDELECLILSEVSLRPNDVNLRVKLLKFYISHQRMEDAYKHAVEVECTYTHHQSLAWYECLYELLSKMKDSKVSKWSFWVFLATASERYAALSLTDHGDKLKSIHDAAQVLLNFDQVLQEAQSKVSTAQDTRLAESMFNHMWGQLNYHLACLLLRRAKREQKNWPETVRLCSPLLLTALHAPIIDPEASWTPAMKHQAQLWHAEGSYRCSQSGHVLVAYCRDNSKRMIDKIGDLMTKNWRDNTFRKIFITFVGKHHESLIKSSYFVRHHTSNPPLRLLSAAALRKNDEIAKQVHPASLHHHVWFGLAHKNLPKDHNDEPYPNAESLVFKGLQYSLNNLSLASAESLSVLDLDVFLNVTILCALHHYSEQSSGVLDPERLPVLPADLTNNLCSTWQENWWTSAYKIYKRHDYPEDVGQMRIDLQRGLEIVRCIGSHGLHINVLVHCGRIFKYRSKVLEDQNPKHKNLNFVRERAEIFWRTAVPLLERKLNKQQIRMISLPVFDYKGKEMNNYELNEAVEEGQLLIAQFFLRNKQYEDAINVLQSLKRPEAAYCQGIVYEKLAEELVDSLPKEAITSSIKDQHCIMLDKAKSCFYLTLDRLRAPGVDPNHPLNAELGTRLADIEDNLYKNNSKLDLEASDESFISAHSLDIVQSPVSHQNLTTRSFPSLRQSTPRIQKDELMRTRLQEARPSPERLDAQIRQLVYAKDNVLHTIIDQQKALIESNTVLANSNQQLQKMVEDLSKALTDFKLEPKKLKSGTTGTSHADSEYAYDDNYGDLSYTNPTAVPPATPAALPGALPGNIFPRQAYSPLVYQNQGLNQGYYPGLPFTDYSQQSLQSFYPPSVYQMPQLYPRATDQAMGVPRMTEMLQQGMITPNMFNSRSMTMFPDLVSSQQQNIQGLNLDLSRSSTSTLTPTPTAVPPVSAPIISIPQIPSSVQQSTTKYTLMNKTPPVNVVITSSDTLPTNVPTVQPTLSIVIPPHHRNVSSMSVANTAPATITSSINTINSSYMSNITNQPNVPHNYQILLPTEAAIPAAIGIPSIFSTPSTFAGHGAPGIGTGISGIGTGTPGTPPNRSKNTSVLSTSHNSSLDALEEHDPIPDFVPVIPLPAEIKVTTGEENEEELFCARAKLFRFVEKEWKDRGVGNVKLLKNQEGKVRLLMRREQVLKICANHLLTPDMELSEMPNNNRAWIWAANDFADEEVRLEKLCIKFKHAEEAVSFKEHFDKYKKSIPVESKLAQELQKVSKPSEPFKGDTKSNSVKVGGFSFSSAPVIKIPPAPEPSKPVEEPAKPSPFAGFSFTKSDPVTSTPFSSFSTIKSTSSTTKPPSSSINDASSIAKTPSRHSQSISSTTTSPDIAGFINDSEEAVLFDQIASLMHSVGDSKQWKDCGTAPLLLILDLKTYQLRLVMKKDAPNSKNVLDLIIPQNAIFIPVSSSPNVLCWSPPDLLASGRHENYAASLGNVSEASELLEKIDKLQILMIDHKIPARNIHRNGNILRITSAIHLVPSKVSSTSTKPLSEMFKPAMGSWECSSCYIRNNAGVSSCVACCSPAPSSSATSVTSTVSSGISSGSLSTPATSIASNQIPLSQLFKPPSDSWECCGCYTRNTEANKYCVACETPSDPSLPPKPKADSGSGSSSFGIQSGSGISKSIGSTGSSSSFSFGIPAVSPPIPAFSEVFKGQNSFGPVATSTTAATVPSFTTGTAETTGISTGTPGLTFKASELDPKTPGKDFVFGNSQKLEAPASAFSFGSPGKSFEFQLSAKSPAKSPGGVEGSEDEVAESEDVYFSPVIPLPEKVDVKTGEENEKVLYKHRAKLFRFDSNTKEWKERGLGDIKLLRHQETKKIRLVMRREQTLKLCLNHFVTKELELGSKDDKTWIWNAVDYSGGEIECVQLACRFKSKEIADQFKTALDAAIKSIDISLESAELSTESAQLCLNTAKEVVQAVISSSTSPGPEVLYERTVTSEEREAALSLQLPGNFYAYTQKDNCSGCMGCNESSLPPFEYTVKKVDKVTKPVTPTSIKLAPAKLSPSQPPFSVSSSTSAYSTPPSSIFSTSNPVTSSFSSSKPTPNLFSTPNSGTSVFSSSTSTTSNTPTTSATTSAPSFFGNSTTNKSFSFGAACFNPSIFGGNVDKSIPTGQQPDESNNTLFGGEIPVCSPTTIDFGKAHLLTNISSTPLIFGSNTSVQSFADIKNETSTPSVGLFSGAKQESGSKSMFGGTSFGSFGTPPAPDSSLQSPGAFGSKLTSASNLNFGTLTIGNLPILSTPKIDLLPKADEQTDNLKMESTPIPDPVAQGKVFGADVSGGGFMNTDNVMTFSSLAANANAPVSGFKTDPNFSFAGAGTTLFSGKSPAAANKSQTTQKIQEDTEEDGKCSYDDTEEYDPHYEPIIPLPDAIVVRTGEEDEVKRFCQRAKLYRFETEQKEWKERGVGDMKVLYHPNYKTYRLVLRREQVYKIVCNFLLTPDLDLQPLTTSERSWMWVGMNFVDNQMVVEKLAVRFKTQSLANEFKTAVENAKEDLSNRPVEPIQLLESKDGDEDHEYQVNEVDDEDDGQTLMFEKPGSLSYSDGASWIFAGEGVIRVVYDPEIFGAKIVFITNDGELVSNSVITIESKCELKDLEIIWTAIDDAADPICRRDLKAQFTTDEFAQEMMANFQEGMEYARQADISETTYYDDHDDT